NLRRTLKVVNDLHPSERHILLAHIAVVLVIDPADPVTLTRKPELFRRGQPGSRDVQQSILFIWIASDPIFAGSRRIDKLDLNAVSNIVEMTVEPGFKWIGCRRTTAFVAWAVIRAAGRM